MALIAFDHFNVSIPPKAEDEARQYYLNILGMNEIPKPEPSASRGGAWFFSGNVHIHIFPEENMNPSPSAHMAIRCDNYQELLLAIKNNGYEIKEDFELDGINRFFTFDPFGNRIELIDANSIAFLKNNASK